jgi:hypothetical protein
VSKLKDSLLPVCSLDFTSQPNSVLGFKIIYKTVLSLETKLALDLKQIPRYI